MAVAARAAADVHEEVLRVPVGSPPVALEVTFYHPDGEGPFPVAVLNHGKDGGDAHRQPRDRAVLASRYFLSRGYAVVIPMLRGFSQSGGTVWFRGDPAKEALLQAQDIQEAVQYVGSHASVPLDMGRVVALGQSYGGWNTLALGALGMPGLKGLIVFAGGRRYEALTTWSDELAAAAGRLGAQTPSIPSLWFYGDNDSLFPKETREAMFNRYTGSGGHAQLVNFGSFMREGHFFLGEVEAMPIWTPRIDEFLDRLNLPAKPLYPGYLPKPFPKPSGFAPLEDVSAVPVAEEEDRKRYREFLKMEWPRVFLITSQGRGVALRTPYDPVGAAEAFAAQHNLECGIYAIDDKVVWDPNGQP
ncbi:MAG: CocE/NonD family hydrolase [Verrucomicrobium sp.]|nr:CocE/NonD family hydrolase [Verrucomicrobium sp.]